MDNVVRPTKEVLISEQGSLALSEALRLQLSGLRGQGEIHQFALGLRSDEWMTEEAVRKLLRLYGAPGNLLHAQDLLMAPGQLGRPVEGRRICFLGTVFKGNRVTCIEVQNKEWGLYFRGVGAGFKGTDLFAVMMTTQAAQEGADVP